MASSGLKVELADHIYQYLCHEVQYSDLPEASKENLKTASECIKQAYNINDSRQQPDFGSASSSNSPDELLRIFTRHKKISNNNKSSSTSGQQNESGTSTSTGTSTSRTKRSRYLIPGRHRHSIGISVHQKNFKQKLVALIKKFRTDGSNFDSEEQYREALERELMKAAAGRGSRAIEELLEEDIEAEGESGSEREDWDNISETSTPKPSLRPFFSSTTLDKI